MEGVRRDSRFQRGQRSGIVDYHREARNKGEAYSVETISLMDLLATHGAPPPINYLSIETEGSELDIFEPFDFSKFRSNAITCEHNYTPSREKIFNLLQEHGYKRMFKEHSHFDDWYIRAGVRRRPRRPCLVRRRDQNPAGRKSRIFFQPRCRRCPEGHHSGRDDLWPGLDLAGRLLAAVS